MSKQLRRAREERKREIIADNVEARRRRSPVQQLRALDRRLGKGVGAVKERARLQRSIEKLTTCWFCTHGWPKPIRDIYDWAVAELDGNDRVLKWGPTHTTWEDENFEHAEKNLKQWRWLELVEGGRFSPFELVVAYESLRKLTLVPMEMRKTPTDDFVPPADWECEHR